MKQSEKRLQAIKNVEKAQALLKKALTELELAYELVPETAGSSAILLGAYGRDRVGYLASQVQELLPQFENALTDKWCLQRRPG